MLGEVGRPELAHANEGRRSLQAHTVGGKKDVGAERIEVQLHKLISAWTCATEKGAVSTTVALRTRRYASKLLRAKTTTRPSTIERQDTTWACSALLKALIRNSLKKGSLAEG